MLTFEGEKIMGSAAIIEVRGARACTQDGSCDLGVAVWGACIYTPGVAVLPSTGMPPQRRRRRVCRHTMNGYAATRHVWRHTRRRRLLSCAKTGSSGMPPQPP